MERSNKPPLAHSSRVDIPWEGEGAPRTSVDLGGVTLETRILKLGVGNGGFGPRVFDTRFVPNRGEAEAVDDKGEKKEEK